MRPCRTLLSAALAALLIPAALFADKPTNEAKVDKLDGTIMVEHVDDAGQKQEIALQTLGVVAKGDIVTVYDKSWVILKTPKGDRIGFLGPAVVAFDELYKGGPDRQIRILLKSGKCYIQSMNSGSRQSFFEVQTGGLVSTLGRAKCQFDYNPTDNQVEIRSFGGAIKTTDTSGDHKYYLESRRDWDKGNLTQRDPQPLPDNSTLEYKTFFSGDQDLYNRIVAADQAALNGTGSPE